MKKTYLYATGIATVYDTDTILDVWYPQPTLAEQPVSSDPDQELTAQLEQATTQDEARLVQTKVV